MNNQKTTVLLVDDKPDNLELLVTILEAQGYRTLAAENGLEALKQLKKNPVDLILSDILMPKMDGYQLCRECKKDPGLRKIPFIFYTATYVDKKDEEFGLNLGANRFLIKPLEKAVFISNIEEVLRESRAGTVPVPKIDVQHEVDYLKEYNERLILKLEDKIVQLQQELQKRCAMEEEMHKRLQELEVFYQSSFSREERIVELKQEVELLKNKLDNRN